MECQLFPVLAYGCHLWNFERSSLVTSVNTAYRKGVRRGLGMRQRDSTAERLPGYIESAVKMKELQLKFLKRATQSRNGLVKGFAWLVCRYNYPGHGLDIAGGNIFALKYHELL